MESSRRQQAQEDLGFTTQKEEEAQQRAIEKEQDRIRQKEEKRQALEDESSYALVKGIKTVMDDFYLDPILGFFVPGAGDIISSICAIPFIWVALVRIKSIPLTLAVIYNTLIDVMLGLIPFYIGDIIDIFNKSYKKNYRLIVGYVEDDAEIIREVNSKAVRSGIFIVVLCVIIYFLAKLTISLASSIWGFFSSLIG